MKYFLIALVGIFLYLLGQEVLDYQETKRYLSCPARGTADYSACSDGSSWLYKHYPEAPRVYQCLWPLGVHEDRPTKLCKLLNILPME